MRPRAVEYAISFSGCDEMDAIRCCEPLAVGVRGAEPVVDGGNCAKTVISEQLRRVRVPARAAAVSRVLLVQLSFMGQETGAIPCG